MRPHRRTVLAAATALAGAAATQGAVAQAADLAEAEPLTLFDPDEPAAKAYAVAQGGRTVPIEGDRIRLARRLFGDGAFSRLIAGRSPADQILLAEAAREHGYRPVALDPFPALDGRSGMFMWVARREPR